MRECSKVGAGVPSDSERRETFERYRRLCVREVRRRFRDRRTRVYGSEDAVQDGLMRLWRVAGQKPLTTLMAVRIATRAAIDGWRRVAGRTDNRRRRASLGACSLVEVAADDDEAELVDARDLAERVLSRCPTRWRLAASLHYREGLQWAEVGDLLGLTEPVVLYRTLRALRRAAIPVILPFTQGATR